MPNTELSENKKKCPLILWVILGILEAVPIIKNVV